VGPRTIDECVCVCVCVCHYFTAVGCDLTLPTNSLQG
jgi:hypothetical protein